MIWRLTVGSILAFCLAACHAVPSRQYGQEPLLMVAISKGAQSATVGGAGSLAIDGSGSHAISSAIVVYGEGDRVKTPWGSTRQVVITAPAPISCNGRHYRGTLLLTSTGGKLLVLNQVPLEQYLKGVVPAEMPAQWPMEALKAQAVVARSYAITRYHARQAEAYHLDSGVSDQVYAGADAEQSSSSQAVAATSGETLGYHGKVATTYFFADCGGSTEDGAEVWGGTNSYLSAVTCRHRGGYRAWSYQVDPGRTESALARAGIAVPGFSRITVVSRDRSGRVREVELYGNSARITIPATRLRKILGYDQVKSTNFKVVGEVPSLRLEGSGYGHGVGLCQEGARSMALDGDNYRTILQHYYAGTEPLYL